MKKPLKPESTKHHTQTHSSTKYTLKHTHITHFLSEPLGLWSVTWHFRESTYECGLTSVTQFSTCFIWMGLSSFQLALLLFVPSTPAYSSYQQNLGQTKPSKSWSSCFPPHLSRLKHQQRTQNPTKTEPSSADWEKIIIVLNEVDPGSTSPALCLMVIFILIKMLILEEDDDLSLIHKSMMFATCLKALMNHSGVFFYEWGNETCLMVVLFPPYFS